jgi:hypothetical protein
MGFYHKLFLTVVVKRASSAWEVTGSIPSRCEIYFASFDRPRVRSARLWDPRVRSVRPQGPRVRSARLRGPRVRSVHPWDPCVRSAHGTRALPVGPVRQVCPWDLRVRADRRVGPTCQVRPTRGTRVSGWSDEIQVYDGWVLHST